MSSENQNVVPSSCLNCVSAAVGGNNDPIVVVHDREPYKTNTPPIEIEQGRANRRAGKARIMERTWQHAGPVAGRHISEGNHEIEAGFVILEGNACLTLGEKAVVDARGCSQVYAHAGKDHKLHEFACAFLSGRATAVADGCANANLTGKASILLLQWAHASASGEAIVNAKDSTFVTASENAQVTANGSSRVTASGNVVVYARDCSRIAASGNAIVHVESSQVSVIASENAHIIVYGGNKPEIKMESPAFNITIEGRTTLAQR